MENKNYLISILVPIYNAEKYLKRCIESVLNQELNDFELVLVDDGSTDKSGEICDSYKEDERVKVIHTPNKGLASARVTGIQNASGAYIGFLDSDDWIEPYMYKKMLDYARNNNASIAIGGYTINSDEFESLTFEISKECVMESRTALLNMLEGRYYNWSLCDKIYKADLFLDSDVINKWPASYGEDTYINWRVFPRAYRICYIPIYGYHYYMHSDSMMHQNNINAKRAYFDIYSDMAESALDVRDFEVLNKVLYLLFRDGMPIIYRGEMEYGQYESEIKYEISVLKKYYRYIDDFNIFLNGNILRERYALICRDRYEIEKRNKEWDKEIQSLEGSSNIYLYGAGSVAEEVINVLIERGIALKGVVTSGNLTRWYFRTLRISSVFDVLGGKDKLTFVLAMNKQNTKEVIQLLYGRGDYDVYDFGQYCYDY